jgi:predicted ArsR family transcriptional regulator
MEWLRLYTDVLDDRRFFQMPAELYRRWTMLLMVAKRHGGQIPPNADIAFALRISEDEARGTLDDLAAYGLIDHGDDPAQLVKSAVRQRQQHGTGKETSPVSPGYVA